jgi:AcrR family transcriptional regulator
MTLEVRTRVPSQARAQRTRADLLAAAATEFARRGWAATTSKSIAQRAGVATGSFYQYFPSKDVVLRELAAARLADIGERSLAVLDMASLPAVATADAVRSRFASVVALVLELHRSDPGLHAVMTERRGADAQLDAIWTTGEHALVTRIAALLERWGASRDPMATAFVAFGMVEGSIHAHVLGKPVVSDDRFIAALVDALFAVVAPAPELATSPKKPPRKGSH